MVFDVPIGMVVLKWACFLCYNKFKDNLLLLEKGREFKIIVKFFSKSCIFFKGAVLLNKERK